MLGDLAWFLNWVLAALDPSIREEILKFFFDLRTVFSRTEWWPGKKVRKNYIFLIVFLFKHVRRALATRILSVPFSSL